MTLRTRGSVPLPPGAVLTELVLHDGGPDVPPADLCALLVDARGCARGPGDFVRPEAAPHHSRTAVCATRAAGPAARATGARRIGRLLALRGASAAGDACVAGTVSVDLAALDDAVAAVLLVARGASGPEGRLPGLRLRVLVAGAEAAVYDRAPADGEPAAVLGALRRDGSGWRFHSVGQGYRTGLAGLAAAHGLRRDALSGLPAIAVAPARRALPPAGRPVPVTLTDASPAVALAVQGGASGALTVTLDRTSTGSGGPDGPVVRLGALYELSDGRKGVIQALGGALGAFDRPPYVTLRPPAGGEGEGPGEPGEGAERAGCTTPQDGARADDETISLNLDFRVRFRRVLFFAMVGHGSGSLAGLRATAVLRPEYGAPIGVPLQECAIDAQVCALALLTYSQEDLVVHREALWIRRRHGVSPQRTVDYAYGWGLTWAPRRT